MSYTLDTAMQKLTHTVYKENPYAFACVNRVAANVVRYGLKAMRGDDPATPEFEIVLERYYVPFCKEVLREVLLYGIVAWDVVKTDGQTVPYVIPGHLMRYTFEYGKNSSYATIKGVHIPTSIEAANVVIWETPDYAERTVSSALSRCVRMHQFESQLLTNAACNDQKIANAPLVLENTATQGGFWALRGYQPFAAQPRTFHNFDQGAAASEHFEQNFGDPVQRVDERLMELQDSYVQKLNTIGSVQAMEFSRTQEEQQDAVPRMQLPPHTRAANVSFSQTRGDLTSIMNLNLDRICAAMGIPRSVFQSQAMHQSEGALRRSQRQFDEVTRIYRPFLNTLLTEAIGMCTAEEDFFLGVATGDDRFAVHPTLELLVSGVETNELIDLYKAGLVEREYVQRQIETDYGLCMNEEEEPEPEPEAVQQKKKRVEKQEKQRKDRDGAARSAADGRDGGDGARAFGAEEK